VRHFEELAERNSELGRHAAAALYEDQLAALAEQVRQYATRCAELEEGHRALQALQQAHNDFTAAQVAAAAIPATLPAGSLLSDGATQTLQEATSPPHLPAAVSTTETGTDAENPDARTDAATGDADVSTQGADTQTDAVLPPEVQDDSTETDIPAPSNAAAALEETISDLRVQLDALRTDRDGLAGTREALEKALATLRAELVAREEEVERHGAEREELLAQVDSLRADLANRSEELKSLALENAARPPLSVATEATADAVQQLASLQSALQELQLQAEQERTENAELVQELRAELAAANSRVLDLTAELAAAGHRAVDSEHAGANAIQAASLEAHIASLTAQLSTEREESAAICRRLEAEVQSLTAQLARQDSIPTVADSGEHGNRVAELHVALSAAASDLAESRQQLMEKNRLLVEAEAQLWHQQKLSELLEKRIATQDVHCTELERTRADLLAQLLAAELQRNEERDAQQSSSAHALPRLVITTDASGETDVERSRPSPQDLHHHATSASAESASNPAAHTQDHTSAPLQFLLPREFLDMTASLQIQMEAVKNISTLVVENLKGKLFALQGRCCESTTPLSSASGAKLL
jgi:hypothetical protein